MADYTNGYTISAPKADGYPEGFQYGDTLQLEVTGTWEAGTFTLTKGAESSPFFTGVRADPTRIAYDGQNRVRGTFGGKTYELWFHDEKHTLFVEEVPASGRDVAGGFRADDGSK